VSLKLHISAEGGFKAALQWPVQKKIGRGSDLRMKWKP